MILTDTFQRELEAMGLSLARVDDHVLVCLILTSLDMFIHAWTQNMTENFAELYKLVVALWRSLEAGHTNTGKNGILSRDITVAQSPV
jgi:hypothetical protein